MDAADVVTVIMMFIGATLPVGLGVAWYNASRRVRQLEAQLRGTDAGPESRLDAVERNVELMAEQMEQLLNDQEFLNRLMTKQLERATGAPAAPPLVTPH